ncbi:MAG: hypothetical protein JO198_10320 [Candidatus Dormibacteraeota bacterium]|nr:hypothetical protein [Candidatus Dormibacteraeota bacterium]
MGEELRCTAQGCDAGGAVPCHYVDRRARRCGAACCAAHRVIAADRAYCRRHGVLIEGILAKDILAAPLPDVDNRAPYIVWTEARAMDAAMRDVLRGYCAAGATLSTRAVALAYFGPSRRRAWTYRWVICDHTGSLLSVALVVDEERPDELYLTVDANEVCRVPVDSRALDNGDEADALRVTRDRMVSSANDAAGRVVRVEHERAEAREMSVRSW